MRGSLSCNSGRNRAYALHLSQTTELKVVTQQENGDSHVAGQV